MHPSPPPLSCCCLRRHNTKPSARLPTSELENYAHIDGLWGRLGLVGLAVSRLAVGLLLGVAAIGLLWLLRVVTALTGRRTCHNHVIEQHYAICMSDANPP